MHIDIKTELKNIILKTEGLNSTYLFSHTNSKYSIDLIIDELLYFLKSGVSWRMLRSPIHYKTLYWHFSKFVEYNIFLKLFKKLRQIYLDQFIVSDNVSLLIDSTIIYNKYGINKIGRNKFYKNKRVTKISLMTDINGFPLSIFFMKGNYHDISVFNKHIKDAHLLIPNKKVKIIADKAYSSKSNYKLLHDNNFSHIIPPRKNMKMYTSYTYDNSEYKRRIRIEHIFSRLKSYKRINTRYDKFLSSFRAFVLYALSLIAINIIKK